MKKQKEIATVQFEKECVFLSWQSFYSTASKQNSKGDVLSEEGHLNFGKGSHLYVTNRIYYNVNKAWYVEVACQVPKYK